MIRALLRRLDTPLPELNYKRCLRLKSFILTTETTEHNKNHTSTASCELCFSHCPKGAISFTKGIQIDQELCNSCGVCTAVCPSEAFSHPRQSVSRLLGVTGMETISIGCMLGSNSGRAWLLPQDAVCGLSWKFIAAALLCSGRRKVRLDCRYCKECKQGAGIDAVRIAAKRAVALVRAIDIKPEIAGPEIIGPETAIPGIAGPEIARPEIEIVDTETDKAAEGEISRREFFHAFAGKANSSARNLAEDYKFYKNPATTPHDFLWHVVMKNREDIKTRQGVKSMNVRQTMKDSEATKTPFRNSAHSSETDNSTVLEKTLPWAVHSLLPNKCKGCGICTRICPWQGWRIKTTGDTRALLFRAQVCRNCGTCVTACPGNAIRTIVPERAALEALLEAAEKGAEKPAEKGAVILTTIPGRRCRRCKKYLSPNQGPLCSNCFKQASLLQT